MLDSADPSLARLLDIMAHLPVLARAKADNPAFATMSWEDLYDHFKAQEAAEYDRKFLAEVGITK